MSSTRTCALWAAALHGMSEFFKFLSVSTLTTVLGHMFFFVHFYYFIIITTTSEQHTDLQVPY